MYYLCATIDRHFNHEEQHGKGAVFSLESHQHGWDAFSRVREGDTVYLIAPNRIVKQAYRVSRVRREDDQVVVYSDQIVDVPAESLTRPLSSDMASLTAGSPLLATCCAVSMLSLSS